MIAYFDFANDYSPSSNQTAIPNLWSNPVDFSYCDILINAAVSADMCIARDIDSMESVGQERPRTKCGAISNVTAMPVGHAVKAKGQNVPDGLDRTPFPPTEQPPIAAQAVSFGVGSDRSSYAHARYSSNVSPLKAMISEWGVFT